MEVGPAVGFQVRGGTALAAVEGVVKAQVWAFDSLAGYLRTADQAVRCKIV